jgi:hypothetical protein
VNVLFWGSFAFCLAFLLQLIIWNIHLPRRQTKVLLLIFCGTLITVVLILRGEPVFMKGLGLPIISDLSACLHVCIYFISLTLAYMITYSAIEVDSPSLVMIMAIAKEGPEGFDKKEFEEIMTDDLLVKPRVDDLVIDKMVYLEGSNYKLTKKGFAMVKIFLIYRKILNLGVGG